MPPVNGFQLGDPLFIFGDIYVAELRVAPTSDAAAWVKEKLTRLSRSTSLHWYLVCRVGTLARYRLQKRRCSLGHFVGLSTLVGPNHRTTRPKRTSAGELIPSARKPCHDDDAAAVAEEALGAGSRLRTVPHLLSHQHTKTGTQTTYIALDTNTF